MNSSGDDSLQDLLLAFLDGALDAETADRVRATIEADPVVRDEYHVLRALYNALDGLGDDRRSVFASVDVSEDVLAAVQAMDANAPLPGDWLDRDDFAGQTIDYWDGSLTPEARQAFEANLDASPVHRAEYELLSAVASDLEAFGAVEGRKLPAIDVSQSVMAAILGQQVAAPPSNVTSFSKRVRQAALFTAAAAAAAVMLSLWFFRPQPESAGGPNVVQLPVPGPVEPAGSDPGDREPGPGRVMPEDLHGLIENLFENALTGGEEGQSVRPLAQGTPGFEATAPPELADLTVEGVMSLRRAAINADSYEKRSQLRAELAQLAKLDAGTAAQIAFDADLSALARLGAATMLPPEQGAEPALLAANELSDSAYAQMAAAEAALAAAVANPGSVSLEDILEPLRRLQELDPQNATGYMMEAAALLQAGDVEGALAALQVSGSLPDAYGYSGEAASATSAALTAAGMDSEAAMTTAALNAGYDEYSTLFDLGLNLLDLGSSFATSGDVETADIIFSSVTGFADALYSSSTYTLEQLAGLDLQRQTLNYLEQLAAAVTQEVATAEQLTREAMEVLNGMTSVSTILDIIDGVLSGPLSPEETSAIVTTIVQQGDTALATGGV